MGEKSKTRLVYVRFMRPDLVSARLLYIYIYTRCASTSMPSMSFFLSLVHCHSSLFFYLSPSPSLSLSPSRQKRTSAHLSLYTPGSFRAQFTFTFVTSLSRLIRFQSFATIFAGCLLKGGAGLRLGEGGERERESNEPFCPRSIHDTWKFFFFPLLLFSFLTPFWGTFSV